MVFVKRRCLVYRQPNYQLLSFLLKDKKGEREMKKYIVGFTIGLLLAVGTTAMAGTNPGTGIQGTAHDMSSGGAGFSYGNNTDSLDRVCIYCHTPHHSMLSSEATTSGVNYYPLWNHDVTVATFGSYTNGLTSGITNTQHNLNAVQTGPGTVSILCLSCHDGSVAVAAYGNLGAGLNPTRNSSGTNVSGTQYQIGANGNLSNHHPIGFDYNAVVLLDDEINDPSTALRGANPNGLTIQDLLWGGTRMECSSCHDVHNTKNEGQKFTWVEDTQSDLCLTCHNK
jgi:predicted CXXCH cytochrome family protein